MSSAILEQTPLAKKTIYIQNYAPELLVPIPRSLKRDEIDMPGLIFHGIDVWNGYELSWLNPQGKPIISLAEFIFSADSSHLIESKSFKLYLNSFNGSTFADAKSVENILQNDLSKATNSQVKVTLKSMNAHFPMEELNGICLDDLDVNCTQYHPTPNLLSTEKSWVEENLVSHLLKSNCLVTGQPDWGSIQIKYEGQKINHANLLRYIISYRDHQGFAEHCTEKIFADILQHCKPKKLTLHVRYTRRGGLDINPIRSTEVDFDWQNYRSCRQ